MRPPRLGWAMDTVLVSDLILGPWFLLTSNVFVIAFGFVFLWFSLFDASLFRALILHWFSIDSCIDLGIIVDGLGYLFCLRTQLAKPSKTIEFTGFNASEKLIFYNFHDLFRYLFWYWFLMTLGINFGSIWYCFALPNSILCWRLFCDVFLNDILIDLGAKCGPRDSPGCFLFPHVFDPVPKVVFLKVPWLTLAPNLALCSQFWVPFGSL